MFSSKRGAFILCYCIHWLVERIKLISRIEQRGNCGVDGSYVLSVIFRIQTLTSYDLAATHSIQSLIGYERLDYIECYPPAPEGVS